MYCILCSLYRSSLFTIANIDPGLRSKLEVINLVSIFHYSLLDVHSFDDILRPLVTDITELQEVSVVMVMEVGCMHVYIY